MRAALRHPLGLLLLGVSLALVVAMRTVPALQPWSAPAPWILFWGLLGYVATIVVVYRTRSEPAAPELRQLHSIRQAMEARLAEQVAAEGRGQPSQRTQILSEAIAQLDRQVAPALCQLLGRQRALSSYLSRIESGRLPMPSPDVLARLRGIHGRQQAAIEECVQQAANAAGTLVALLQEGDDEHVAEQARVWANDLLNLYDAIAEVLRGERREEELGGLLQPPGSASSAVAALGLLPAEPSGNGDSLEGFPRLVQEALRRFNEPAALSRCELINRLPNTLAATRARWGNGEAVDPTPLKQSQALREVLGGAIEGLKPAGSTPRPGSPEALQYHILHEEYGRGLSTASIMVRYSISESTFHRHRREAISAVARELMKQEELLGQQALPH